VKGKGLNIARRPTPGYKDLMKILFLHGWQSVPGGVKLTFLVRHGHEVINPKLPDDGLWDESERLKK